MYSETKWLMGEGIFRAQNLDLPGFFADLVQRSTGTHTGRTRQTERLLVGGFDVGGLESDMRNKAALSFIIPRGKNYTGGVHFSGRLGRVARAMSPPSIAYFRVPRSALNLE
jgi:hypothetical protein